jgi:nicotinate-nucleotide adenylyltransferase
VSESGPRIGIIGGTFDPIHHGHLFVAEEARVRFGLARVLVIPHGQAPHKEPEGITPAERRYAMCELAVASNPALEVSRVEIDRPARSYTIHTLLALREAYGEAAEFYFIIGADAVLEIMTWYRPDDVLREAQLVAVNRPGSDLSELADVIGEERAARVQVMQVPDLEISSTDIRERVREGRPVRYLVPHGVVQYIGNHRLYREEP